MENIDPSSGESRDFDIYNVSKGEVDVVDEIKNSYKVYSILFILNIFGINLNIVFNSATRTSMECYDFLKDLKQDQCFNKVRRYKAKGYTALKSEGKAFLNKYIQRDKI